MKKNSSQVSKPARKSVSAQVAERASKRAHKKERRGKRRAVIATARKLAVILHTLWRKGEDYDPTYGLPAEAAVG
jgi:hypothetical protein